VELSQKKNEKSVAKKEEGESRIKDKEEVKKIEEKKETGEIEKKRELKEEKNAERKIVENETKKYLPVVKEELFPMREKIEIEIDERLKSEASEKSEKSEKISRKQNPNESKVSPVPNKNAKTIMAKSTTTNRRATLGVARLEKKTKETAPKGKESEGLKEFYSKLDILAKQKGIDKVRTFEFGMINRNRQKALRNRSIKRNFVLFFFQASPINFGFSKIRNVKKYRHTSIHKK